MTFFIFGDSVANGYGLTDAKFSCNSRVGYRTGWTPSLHGINASKVGAQRTEIEAQTITSSDQVVWIAGYNDMRADTAWATFQTDFEAALDYIVARTSNVWVCGCFKMTATGYTQGGPDYDNGSDSIANTYNSNMASSCAGKGVTFVDPNDFYDVNQVQADWVHPTNRGHFQISRALLSIIPDGLKSAVGLEYDATITTSGNVDENNWIGENAVDASTTTHWAQWASANEWITLTWGGSVTVYEIRLRTAAPNGMWGIVRFTFSDASYSDGFPAITTGGDITYVLLRPKATTSLKIGVSPNGPGQGSFVGFSEINVKGSYTTTPTTDLTKPDDLTVVSSFSSSWTRDRVIDGVTANEWASSGAGAGAWIQWNYNNAVRVDSIQLRDRTGGTDRWGTPRFTFSDVSTQDGGEAVSDSGLTTYTLTPTETTSLRVTVLSGGTGSNRGLAEAIVTGDVLMPSGGGARIAGTAIQIIG